MSAPSANPYDGSEIAVVGLSGRFPGAPDLSAFWRNLAGGVESVTRFSEDEVRAAGEEAELLANPEYVRARPILDGVELFDAGFFGLTPREAEVLDPQTRLFLECAFEAFEHAGHDPERFAGRASLFAGSGFSNYLVKNLYKNRPVMEAFGDMQATLFNVQDSLVTMVGYKLNLKGACCAVQTFCSTSLVGVHLACQNLLNYESDLALAGGVTVFVPQHSGYLYQEGGIVSREGRCRAFDARADGTVFGNGVGVVVLRRLADALKDGDTVHAVIRGSAVNNDGSLKVSFAAPGVVGQTEVVVEALSAADVDPDTIGYVEAHGTGTRLGDPAEVSALTKAFRTGTERTGFCALGSVKTNVGHLDAAAGVAGLIKVVLALQNGKIPPSLHFETPNPAIDFGSTPFFVNTALRDWPRGSVPRRAGVSAFGVGGTNAHVILEEGPAPVPGPRDRRHQLLVLSAKTPEALDAATKRLLDHLVAHPEQALADVAFTLQVGRGAFAHRRTVVCADAPEAAALLAGADAPANRADRRNPPVVLVLGGEPLPNELRDELIAQEPAFRDALREFEASEAGLKPGAGLVPGGAAGQYALGRLFQSWGLRLEAVTGKGAGALVADCLSKDALDLGQAAVRFGETRATPQDAEASLRALPVDPERLRIDVSGGDVLVRRAADAARGNGARGPRGREATRARVLEALGGLWRSGVDVDWPAVHGKERRQRVPLPTYPFDRQRFWVEPVPEEEPETREPARWLYRPVWKTAMPASSTATPPAGCCLIFADSFGLGARIAERLRAQGAEAITVGAGSSFGGDPRAGYALDPREARHYALLFEDLARRGQRPDRLLHLWSMESLEAAPPGRARFERACDLGFYSLVRLNAARPAGSVALTVISTGLHDVHGDDVLVPEKAPLAPLLRVLGQEDHELRCSLVDVEAESADLAALADAMLGELALDPPEPVVAHRRGRRWVQDYEPIPASTALAPRSPVREGGVYLITGGLGDVGFLLGAALAKGARAKLVLTGRRGLPPRDQWPRCLEAKDASDDTALRIRRVQTLEGLGAEVLVQKADASLGSDMREVVRAARERFGPLQGVIHAAGELSPETFRAARDLEPGTAGRQFAAKVHGLYALEEALATETLDFCVLTSSLSSVLGGIGYAAYAGANAFMDAFAARASRPGSQRWLSVAFDQWDVGGRSGSGAARQAIRDGSALTAVEGIAVFDRALRLPGLDRVVVSTAPLAARLERWVRQPTAPAAAPESARPRPALGTAYVAPTTDAERTLAGIWQELLGLERVGRNDNFFELGGHSLFAARVLSRVRGAFGVSLPLEAVFEDPTLMGLAARAEAARWARKDAEAPAGDRVEIEI